jgi:5'-3' exonuclease
MSMADIESYLIADVILNINKYIHFINPSMTIFIAFDGVAPFAKMEQQRTRRYKSHYLSTVFPHTKAHSRWNTAAITPGTDFMNKLSNVLTEEFANKEEKYGVKQIVVSGSNISGEGEHKMYEHMRQTSTVHDTVAVYGLDSDLIMLSIFHTIYCKNIYIFREAPTFGDNHKSNNGDRYKTDPKLPLFLDVNKLMRSISLEMDCCNYYDKSRVFDYVFLCFFLGNDFLPHFPALNIRTHGIQALLDTYRMTVAKQNQYLLTKDGSKIMWKNVNMLVKELAKNEHHFLLQEYDTRSKWDNKQWPETTPKEKEDLLNNVPVIFRAEEKYICPHEAHWETRYYATLFHTNIDDSPDFIENVCINYLEGLEWVYTYYTRGCQDWRWKYHYHYPPLLADLVKYIPFGFAEFIRKNEHKPFSPYVQLSYVLPSEQLRRLLPEKIAKYLLDNYPEIYNAHMKFQWAFCRYFWESHSGNMALLLPQLNTLEQHFDTLLMEN